MHKKLFLISGITLMFLAILLGLAKGTFTYKSSNREIVLVVESQDAETASAALSLLSFLLSAKAKDYPRN